MILNELFSKNNEKIGKKTLQNEKVRVRYIENFEEMLKRFKKERVIEGINTWNIKKELKVREIFDNLNVSLKKVQNRYWIGIFEKEKLEINNFDTKGIGKREV